MTTPVTHLRSSTRSAKSFQIYCEGDDEGDQGLRPVDTADSTTLPWQKEVSPFVDRGLFM